MLNVKKEEEDSVAPEKKEVRLEQTVTLNLDCQVTDGGIGFQAGHFGREKNCGDSNISTEQKRECKWEMER